MLARTIFPEIPPGVEYKLTKLVNSILLVDESIKEWGLRHIKDITE
jgi:DNA-binding HxlR family transcriptional regulator